MRRHTAFLWFLETVLENHLRHLYCSDCLDLRTSLWSDMTVKYKCRSTVWHIVPPPPSVGALCDVTTEMQWDDNCENSPHILHDRLTLCKLTPCGQRGRGWCRPAVSGLKAGLCVAFEGLQFPREAWTALRWASLCVMENPAFPSSWDKTTSTCLRERKSSLHPSAEHVLHLESCSNPSYVCLNFLTWLSGDF